MFRQPGDTGGTPPREPRAPAVFGPSGFHETVLFPGLISPTSIAFAADGRIFIAEKWGRIKVFDSLTDTTPTTYADLSLNVYDYWDRGLLGIALDPAFTTNGRVYVLYTYNHILGDAAPAPKWVNGAGQDICDSPPNGPGATTDGCVASARLSRLETGGGGTWDGNEHVLVEAWCQVHPSHSIGTVAFGPDGALYAGGGDAASFMNKDYGQDFGLDDTYTPDNPCGDPPSPVGTELTIPSAEGGSLRAQDLQTRSVGDPVGLSGTIIRVDPTTGLAKPDNANIADTDLNARRIIAYGLRNPFRFTFRPGTNELWIGDVGDTAWEEFDRVVSPTAAPRNFGWPCYEGALRKPSFDNFNLTLCEDLYADGAGAVQNPYYAYYHTDRVVPTDPSCPNGAIAGSVISGTAFYPLTGGVFPAANNGALFFADYGRNCIWSIPAGAGGLPDTSKIATFASGLAGPVDLKVGPDGALYYVGFDDGSIHRITVGPAAVAKANPASGPAPLTVQFNGSSSTDPKGGVLTYAWDLDDDGLYDDSTAKVPAPWTYTTNGVHVARLKVTDTEAATDIASVSIAVGNHPPVAQISTPSAGLTWSVGDTITYGGRATDIEDGNEPGSRLAWSLLIEHCPDACHTHAIQTGTGVGGSFPAPDHEYPSSLIIRLVATDAFGATSAPVSIKLLPKTVNLGFASKPSGVQLTVGEVATAAPFTQTVINKSVVQVTAPATATIGGKLYAFAGWSDGNARVHLLTATSTTSTLTANYAPATTYVPITPVRVVDTRVSGGRLPAGVPRTFAVGGTPRIPSNAVAVTGNLTAVLPTQAGWVGLTSAPTATPATSALNLPAGDTRANGVTMRLGSDGKLAAVFKGQTGSTHLILDVTGYFVAADTGARFTPIGPARVLDSRSGAGGYSTPFVSGTPRTFQLGGVAGMPSDAVAVAGNLTVTGQTAGGYVSMTTNATSTPAVSTINMPVGDTRANGLTIRLNGNGRASLVFVGGKLGTDRANLIFDVTGFYRAGTAGLRFYPMEPRRIFDTRAANAPSLQAGVVRTIDVLGPATIAADAAAIASNVTVVGQTAGGYLAVTTQPTTTPTTSTINFPIGDTRANNGLNALDSLGRLRAIYRAPAGSRTHFIVDLAGYFR